MAERGSGYSGVVCRSSHYSEEHDRVQKLEGKPVEKVSCLGNSTSGALKTFFVVFFFLNFFSI